MNEHVISIYNVYVVLSVFVITGQYSSDFRDANCCVCALYRFTVRLWSLYVGVSVLTHVQLNTNIVDSFHIHLYIHVSANSGQNGHKTRTATAVTLTGDRNG